ncbi:manganese-dependent ADP-ribose/CDP-alcohol diphosphatase-like [Ylistrum balloti]|uniref:manganese-dependent ADP-ribose/CDP-alcohol diphosphatase-like n=1 Tax=Ylistrum balloti TaxID=509963 RepID=UPI0029059B94|nr:manganese-dependent ADP-ribose/CDP-alcohol diphosphatase-like [Ylistrum balloti]
MKLVWAALILELPRLCVHQRLSLLNHNVRAYLQSPLQINIVLDMLTNCTSESSTQNHQEPICKVGIIADVQYANLEDRFNFTKTRLRFYRKALTLLKRAVTDWSTENVDCVLQLGDIIDGFNKAENASDSALATVTEALKHVAVPVYHTWGNHELYNFTQKELMNSVLFSGNLPQCTCPEGKSYYSFHVHRKLKVLVLNCYEISMLGLPEGSEEYTQAEKMLRDKNPNEDLNSPVGLTGTDRRFVKFNGTLSSLQLQWLNETLQEARENETNVIIIGHISIHEGSADSACLCYDHEDILKILSNHGECVLCYLAGHDHEGGSCVDSSGILHVTFPGTVESSEPDAHATAYLYKDSFAIHGKGSYPSFETKLRYPIT